MNYENQTDKIYLNWTGFGNSFKYRAFASTSSVKICNQAIGVVKVNCFYCFTTYQFKNIMFTFFLI